MSWRTVLVEDGEVLRLKLDNILIEKEEKEYVIPLSDISIIVVDGQNTQITTRLLTAISEHNIGLVTCNQTHHPIGLYHGLNTHSRASKVMQKQIQVSDDIKGELWRQIVEFKIQNQLEVLKAWHKEPESIQKLESYITQIKNYDKTNREGHAAKVYFNALFGMGFTREDEDNVINYGLNYGYAIFRAHLARLIVGYGLSPIIGIFHRSEYNAFNLADDLIEVFRPFIDYFVYDTMRNNAYFTRYDRMRLIDLVNQRCFYKDGRYTLQTIMQKFVVDILNVYETGEILSLKRPQIELFEVRK